MTNIGSIAVVGLSGAAAATGIPVIVYELFVSPPRATAADSTRIEALLSPPQGVFGILIMGFVFMPIFYKARVFTAPQYLQKRFGGNRLQVYMSVQTVILQLLMKIPVRTRMQKNLPLPF